jgi:hypothetical protein
MIMSERRAFVIHECGHKVEVIDDGIAPHFIVDDLHLELCPTCFRSLINDWMDEPWRFWTREAWDALEIWRLAIDGTEEER